MFANHFFNLTPSQCVDVVHQYLNSLSKTTISQVVRHYTRDRLLELGQFPFCLVFPTHCPALQVKFTLSCSENMKSTYWR